MSLEENWKSMKPQSSPSQILDFLEQMLKHIKKSKTEFRHDLGEDVFSHLAQITVSNYQSSLKSSIEKVTRPLSRLLSDYPQVPLPSELCIFHNILGKAWKRHEKFEESEKSLTTGINIARTASLLHPIHVKLLLNLCKVYNKQQKFKESLQISKEAVSVCQDIVCQDIVTGKNNSNLELAGLTCSTYLQVSSQESFLGNLQQSYHWCLKAERILSQNPKISKKFSLKLQNLLENLRNETPVSVEQKNVTSRKFTENFRQLTSQKVKRHQSSNEGNLSNQKSLPRIDSVHSNSSRKRIIHKTPKELVSHEQGKVEILTDRLGTQFNFDNFISKPAGVSVAIQTDSDVKELKVVHGDDLEFRPFKFNHIPEVTDMALVKQSKISIKFKFYDIKYYLSNDFQKIKIVLYTEEKPLSKEFDVDPDLPVLEMINKKLHPCIDLGENGEIVIVDDVRKHKANVTIFKADTQGSLQIFQRTPRGDIIVRLEKSGEYLEKLFSASELIKKIDQSDLSSEEYLQLCFEYINEEIILRPPRSKVELLYARYMKIGKLPKFLLKVSKASYENSEKYLFHAIDSKKFTSLFIDENLLSEFYKLTLVQVELNIEKICKFLSIRSSQFVLDPGEIIVEEEELIMEKNKSAMSQDFKLKDKPEETPAEEVNDLQEEVKDLQKEEQLIIKLQSNIRGFLVRKTHQSDKLKFESFICCNRKIRIKFREMLLFKKLRIQVTHKKDEYYLTLRTPITEYQDPYRKSMLNFLTFNEKRLYLRIPNDPEAYIFHKAEEIADENIGQKALLGYEMRKLKTQLLKNDYDRIIFRTCLCKEDVMYQITMMLHKSEDEKLDVLHFYVRNGPNPEHTQRFVIDLEKICEKSQSQPNQFERIGSYVVQNMFKFVGKEVSFLNFDNDDAKARQHLIRIQAFVRGMLTRKRVKNLPRRNVCKFDINSFGKKWNCNLNKDAFYYYLVVSNQKISGEFKLIGRKVDLESPDLSIKEFFRNKLRPMMSIVEEEGKIKVRGLEEFIIKT